MDLDGIPWQQNSKTDLDIVFNPVYLLFVQAAGRKLFVFLVSQIHMHLETVLLLVFYVRFHNKILFYSSIWAI